MPTNAALRITNISRSYSRKVTYRDEDGTLISVEAPIWLSAEVTYNPADVNLDDLVRDVGRDLLRTARRVSLRDLQKELPPSERAKLKPLLEEKT